MSVVFLLLAVGSLSARRAWIEIPAGCWRDARRAVALRKESVDRNDAVQVVIIVVDASLSARRAWIEMVKLFRQNYECLSLSARRAWIEIDFEGKLDADLWVALRKESVDRNIAGRQLPATEPPSLSARRAWIEICFLWR